MTKIKAMKDIKTAPRRSIHDYDAGGRSGSGRIGIYGVPTVKYFGLVEGTIYHLQKGILVDKDSPNIGINECKFLDSSEIETEGKVVIKDSNFAEDSEIRIKASKVLITRCDYSYDAEIHIDAPVVTLDGVCIGGSGVFNFNRDADVTWNEQKLHLSSPSPEGRNVGMPTDATMRDSRSPRERTKRTAFVSSSPQKRGSIEP